MLALILTLRQTEAMSLQAWRIGLHGNETRFVVESDTLFPLQTVISPTGDRLIIPLPAATKITFGPHPIDDDNRLIAGLAIDHDGSMPRLILLLCRPVITHQIFWLSPGEHYAYRLVIDLAAASAAKPSELRKPVLAVKPVKLPKPLPQASLPIAAETTPALAPTVSIPAAYTPPGSTPPVPQPKLPLLTDAAAHDAPPANPPAASPPSLSRIPTLTATIPPAPGFMAASAAPVLPPSSPTAPMISVVTPSPKDNRFVVALDPGHGGIDPGASSRNGIHEKTVTLATALEIRRVLEATGRYRVYLTRADDTLLRLRERVRLAREAGAGLFISIHADALATREINGLSVYTLSDIASDREAEALATKENKADIITGINLTTASPDVSTMLIDLARRQTQSQSSQFTEILLSELKAEVPILTKAHRAAGFGVLTASDMPSVLVELGYLSNPTDETRLTSEAERAKLAAGFVRAIDRFTNSTAGPTQTAQRH